MSPEQARGQMVDKRTDIWAFGCVLYEMLTGHSAFERATISDTLAAVLEREPDWDALPPATPGSVRRVLERCLEKDPRRRVRDIADARAELDIPDKRNGHVPPARSRLTIIWTIAAAASTIVTVVALTGWWRATRPMAGPVLRFPVDLGHEATNPINGPGVIISPDGTRIVYRVRDARGTVRLFTRTLDTDQATVLPGTERAIAPFFSPDGQSVGFFDVLSTNPNGKLKKVSVREGNAVELCDVVFARGASWGDDGNIVVSLEARGPLFRIPSTGGTPQAISKLGGAVTHRWPQVLPGAQAVIFTANGSIGNFDQATVEILSLKTGEQRTLVRGGYSGRYVPTGHLLYVRNQTLYAAAMDVDRQALTGPPAAVLTGFTTRVPSGGVGLDISANGTLVYAAGSPLKQRLVSLDAGGHVEEFAARRSQYIFQLRFSPDGRRLAVTGAELGNLDVWIYEKPRDAWTRLTSSPDLDSFPVWSPDGAHVAFLSAAPSSGVGISWKGSDGTGDVLPRFRQACL